MSKHDSKADVAATKAPTADKATTTGAAKTPSTTTTTSNTFMSDGTVKAPDTFTPAQGDRSNDIPKSSLTSGVTTDMANNPVDQAASDKAMADHVENDATIRAGLGLVKVDGIDFRYIGVAPAREQNATTPGGIPITSENSTFTPLNTIPFSNSIRIKDPSSGEYYFPADGVTSWAGCELNGCRLYEDKQVDGTDTGAKLDAKANVKAKAAADDK